MDRINLRAMKVLHLIESAILVVCMVVVAGWSRNCGGHRPGFHCMYVYLIAPVSGTLQMSIILVKKALKVVKLGALDAIWDSLPGRRG
jgi:hypothetical protein